MPAFHELIGEVPSGFTVLSQKQLARCSRRSLDNVDRRIERQDCVFEALSVFDDVHGATCSTSFPPLLDLPNTLRFLSCVMSTGQDL
jgi:hypothetical protein